VLQADANAGIGPLALGAPGQGELMTDRSDLKQVVEQVTARTGFTSSIGARVVAVEKGKVELALAHRSDLLQFNGYFHGGVIAALADHAAGGAVTTALPEGKIGVTVDLHVNFLAPANGEMLVAKATAIQIGANIAVSQVDLFTIKEGAGHACAIALVTLRAVDMAPSL